jgi:hypothetical protein
MHLRDDRHRRIGLSGHERRALVRWAGADDQDVVGDTSRGLYVGGDFGPVGQKLPQPKRVK